MDYEKKYKEALERAKKMMDSKRSVIVNKQALETIFPELKESDDERVRKELKEAFEAYDIESTWNGIPIRSIFAWLEKQKEQKPAEVCYGFKGDPGSAGFYEIGRPIYRYFRKVLASFGIYAENEKLLEVEMRIKVKDK